jgi:methionine synthase II (cobalamin-independent)
MIERVWAPGSVTGVGSMPGTDSEEAQRLVLGEFGLLPHLVELPARGPGAQMVGRGATLLTDLPVEIAPSGWRLSAHAGRDLHRARDLLDRDLDLLTELAGGHVGALKVQLAGPWTLAANLELPSGHRVVTDHGATRDLTESLAEGLREHLSDLRRRLPTARLVVQLDEPSIPAVLSARVPTPSGYGTVRSVEASVVQQRLEDVLAVIAPGARVVHCCAADVPIGLMHDAGADAISFDVSAVGTRCDDAIGVAVEAGVSMWLGVVPATDTAISRQHARTLIDGLWGRLGFAKDELAAGVVATPACGLAGASATYARRVLEVLTELGRELIEEGS